MLSQPQPLEKPALYTPDNALREIFGYSEFRGEQREIIHGVLKGENCLVLMPTGSGKSLCYQIPALCRRGVGIVVSPLIALMQDQVAALHESGVRAATINSALDSGKLRQTYDALRAGGLDLLYVAPERLMTGEFLNLLSEIEIALLAIDEAHCISQWGHDFRPEYRELARVRARFPHVPCIAVTATADEPTRRDIMERLGLKKLYTAGFDRPNITYEVAIKDNPKAQLLAFLKGREAGESGIVYCLSRRKVEEMAEYLRDRGYRALPYHAGLDAGVRADNQEKFLKEEGVIIVATIAFGMGINKPDVRFVAHLDLPKNIEAYYQETGRAGRDGLPATAWMVYGLQDVALLAQRIRESDAPDEQKRLEQHKLNAFLGYCESIICRRQVLLSYFGDESPPCGNCDICFRPPETVNGTVAAQKALSCVYRTGQMFGAGHIIAVLRGGESEKIRKFGHDTISTYGIGQEHSQKEWQGILRQIVARGLLAVDMAGHGALKITAQGAAFLKEKQTIALRKDKTLPKAEKMRAADTAATLESEAERELLADLKALRLKLAKEQNLPPYVIFHDKTLVDMIRLRPQTIEDLHMVSGIGARKAERYGAAFLALIRQDGSLADTEIPEDHIQ